MPVPGDFSAISATPASNSPAGSEAPSLVDDYLRTVFAFLKSIQANSGNGWTSPYSTPASLAAAIAAITLPTDGSYTPTATIVQNLDSVTPSSAIYVRSANTVTVAGVTQIDLSSGGATSFRLSLPIASAFTTDLPLSGVAVIDTSGGVSASSMAIKADATNDRALFVGSFGGSFVASLRYTYTYRIS
jgi:hypothetical protein